MLAGSCSFWKFLGELNFLASSILASYQSPSACHTGQGSHFAALWLHLKQLPLWLYFQINQHFRVMDVRTSIWPLGQSTYILNFNKIDFLHLQVLSYICLVRPLYSVQKPKMYTFLYSSTVSAVRVTTTLEVSIQQKSQRVCSSTVTSPLLLWERTDLRLVGSRSLDWTELEKTLSVPTET